MLKCKKTRADNIRPGCSFAFILGCLLMLAGPTLWAQGELVNPDFDDDLSGWTLGGNPLPVWDSMDVDNSADSGSAFIQNTEAGESTDIEVLEQCIEVVPGIWELFARVFIPDNQDRTGSVVIRYGVHREPDCTGGTNAVGGWLTTVTGQWTELGLFSPINVLHQLDNGSIRYVIAIRKTEANGNFSAYVDQARTVFTDLGFDDGFEAP